jgi:AcrR family transcriptional regulator
MATAQGQVRPSIGLGCLRRRRGSILEDAIRQAAYAELIAVGYAAFTVEGVAARAHTGKASIYRRWPTKTELILDSLTAGLPDEQDCEAAFELEDDVTTADALRALAGRIADILNSPAGDAIRAIKSGAVDDSELARAIDERFQAPRRAALLGLLRRGIERGEVRPDAVTDCVLEVLPAMLTYRVVMMREQLTDSDIAAIVNDVLIPLVEA